MSYITGIHNHILEGFKLGGIALLYYKQAKPHKNYTIKQATTAFTRDANLDYDILNQVVFTMCSNQVNEFTKFKNTEQND